MKKKLVFIFFFFLSASYFFSQKSIKFDGIILSAVDNKKIFGATLHLVQNNNIVSKSISESNGTFFIESKFFTPGKFDLIISKSGFWDYKIYLDLSSLDHKLEKEILLKLRNNTNISLSPRMYNQNPSYDEKYTWAQEQSSLVEDETYRLQLQSQIESGIFTVGSTMNKIDSSSIKINDDRVLSEVDILYSEAVKLSKNKNYDSSISKFNEAVGLLKTLSIPKNQEVLMTKIEADKKKIVKLKNSDDQAFNSQLTKAKENFALGRKGYAKAKTILGTAPMKSRANDPELIALTEKINNMESYYKMKDASYLLVKSKNKNNEAIDNLKLTQKKAESYQAIVPVVEFSQLIKSIDSLEKIVNPNKITVVNTSPISPSTSNQGTTLLAPGEIYNGLTKDAYIDIQSAGKNKDEIRNSRIKEIKDNYEYEMHYNIILKESKIDEYLVQIEERKDQIDQAHIYQIKMKDNLQKKNDSLANVFQFSKNERNSNNTYIDSLIRERKFYIDSINIKRKEDLQITIENRFDKIAENKSITSKNDLANKDAEDAKTSTIANYKNASEDILFQKDSINKSINEAKVIKINEQKNYTKIENVTVPNFLKNPDGVLYEKNKMTQEIYHIKNSEGFVITEIRRRIVVDKNGFGIVYEHHIDIEGGKSFFSRNGFVITERIWFNESTGEYVIEK